MSSDLPAGVLEESVFELLAATELLWQALAESSPSEDWDLLLERRGAALRSLAQGVAGDSGTLSVIPVAARACLERIAELDGAILQTGGEALLQLQKERMDLGRRRRAVLAHGLQEREMPRAVTVKA